MDIKKTIQNRIKQRRKELKLTQEELGKRLNTTKSSISNYENGYSFPTNESLVHLAKELRTSTDWILGLTNDPESSGSGKNTMITNNDSLENRLDFLVKKSRIEGRVYLDESEKEYMDYEDILWLKRAYENAIKKKTTNSPSS